MPENQAAFDGIHLPYSLEAEQAVLGSILIDPQSIVQVSDLRENHFYLPEHRAAWRVMYEKMSRGGSPIDYITVLEALKSDGFFSNEEGRAYLLKITQLVPSVGNIQHYAKIIYEKFIVRSLIEAARKIMEEALDPGVDVAKLVDAAEQMIFELRQEDGERGLISIRQVLVQVYDILSQLADPSQRAAVAGIPSGIGALDEYTGGLNRSDLIIVGSRPGMGKTSFALNLARNVAGQGKTVAMFNLEMSREQLVNRLLSTEARVSLKKLRTGALTADEWTRIGKGAEILCTLPVYIDDTSTVTVADIKARLRRMDPLPDFVIVDYLQLMQSAKKTENRVTEVSDITRNLKIMAKELRVPVLVCAQLSRGTEKKGSNHRPALADLRESGSIEQDADQVLFLYRDEYYINEKDDPTKVQLGTSEVIVAKNRHGDMGKVELNWQGEFTLFTSPTNRIENE